MLRGKTFALHYSTGYTDVPPWTYYAKNPSGMVLAVYHDVNGDHEQHYDLFGAEKGQVARRNGWLDREIDWESSPLTDLYRTVDLVNRKYDPQRGVFLIIGKAFQL